MFIPPPETEADPCKGYVTKLGLVCSPSVTTGDPVFSNSLSVSTIAFSYSLSRSPVLVAEVTASISPAGRGMLPIGSVGICMVSDLIVKYIKYSYQE
jgi:hypothetical protein